MLCKAPLKNKLFLVCFPQQPSFATVRLASLKPCPIQIGPGKIGVLQLTAVECAELEIGFPEYYAPHTSDTRRTQRVLLHRRNTVPSCTTSLGLVVRGVKNFVSNIYNDATVPRKEPKILLSEAKGFWRLRKAFAFLELVHQRASLFECIGRSSLLPYRRTCYSYPSK